MHGADPILLLDWYAAMGVDVALDEDPVDRFLESMREAETRRARALETAASLRAVPSAPTEPSEAPLSPPFEGARPPSDAARAPRPTARPLPTERPRFEPPPQPVARPSLGAVVPGDAGVVAAREAAASAASLDDLRAALERFDGCNLRLTARRLVFADGAAGAKVMFVGEAPGREEDEAGLPFVGRSGRLLDRMLAAIGIARSEVYIANVVPWRPPGNRTPTPQETEICKPFVARQIELVGPKVLVFLGGASAAALTGATQGIMRLRGRWLTHRTSIGEVPALPTLHPAYLLRQPAHKRLAWRDFLEIRRRLDGEN
ncbi:MAG: uracil-DNA glycosylase [Hyphomicrobiales bacterium]|nr:uracil-DNA glycosylase [Hyphomicrobiales bacterium]